MLTFTGALQDTVSPGTGFLHLGNRWYSPPVEPFAGVGNQVGPGHFTQPDSYTQLDNPANGNLYAYAADSPTNYIDPTGQGGIVDILGGIATVLGGIAGSLATWVGGFELSPIAGFSLLGLGVGVVAIGLAILGIGTPLRASPAVG